MIDNRKRYLLIFLFLCFAGGNVQAEELTWEDCVIEAKQNHPDLVSAEEKLNQAIKFYHENEGEVVEFY